MNWQSLSWDRFPVSMNFAAKETHHITSSTSSSSYWWLSDEEEDDDGRTIEWVGIHCNWKSRKIKLKRYNISSECTYSSEAATKSKHQVHRNRSSPARVQWVHAVLSLAYYYLPLLVDATQIWVTETFGYRSCGWVGAWLVSGLFKGRWCILIYFLFASDCSVAAGFNGLFRTNCSSMLFASQFEASWGVQSTGNDRVHRVVLDEGREDLSNYSAAIWLTIKSTLLGLLFSNSYSPSLVRSSSSGGCAVCYVVLLPGLFLLLLLADTVWWTGLPSDWQHIYRKWTSCDIVVGAFILWMNKHSGVHSYEGSFLSWRNRI